ncbi:hypothetical protein I6I98_08840 [Sphingobacterium multivorum]|uniref:Uncharacterized protein n=1 Tax=Sphingobacterium multivorum TaxID=28454 RepID=A0ABX7CU72_SPHMU|nr:hypothetical protein [Sphingobacterium multivorum]QQT55344.1 hypothetical protein I6I98_08840 [Sphingobacterium multivorum]
MAENKTKGLGRQIPPDLFHVKVYFSYFGRDERYAAVFFDHYQSLAWKNQKGQPISNWKVLAWQWLNYDFC